MEWWSQKRRRPGPLLFLHLDIDAFLASVAQLWEPGLIGRPVVVGSGVVASRSYEAKAKGVETAMRIREAQERCEGLVLRAGDARLATRFRERVAKILGSFVPVVEISSLDDMYGDLRGLVGGDQLEAGLWELCEGLRARVRAETGLSISLGIGATKTLARLATGRAKPASVYWIRPGEERAFLATLPVEALPGVGPKTAEQLARYQIRRVAELRLVDRALLRESFGARGEALYWKARGLPAGEADRCLEGGSEHGIAGGSWGEGGSRTQLSRETTLTEPTAEPAFLFAMLSYLVDRGSHRLRSEGLVAQRLEVALALAGTQEASPASLVRPRSVSRLNKARSLDAPTANRARLTAVAAQLLDELLEHRCLVRKIGVCFMRLNKNPGVRQKELFVCESEPGGGERLDRSLDLLRDKHGFGAVVVGESIGLMGKLVRGRDGFRLRTPSLSL